MVRDVSGLSRTGNFGCRYGATRDWRIVRDVSASLDMTKDGFAGANPTKKLQRSAAFASLRRTGGEMAARNRRPTGQEGQKSEVRGLDFGRNGAKVPRRRQSVSLRNESESIRSA
jgi:hypothetical protein